MDFSMNAVGILVSTKDNSKRTGLYKSLRIKLFASNLVLYGLAMLFT